MAIQSENPTEEIRRLRRCINDLVSVLALPAVWSGGEPSRILGTLLDALMGVLDLDFLYARMHLDSHEAPIDALRTAPLYGKNHNQDEIRRVLNHRAGEGPQRWLKKEVKDVGGQEISLFPIKIGTDDELGFVVAGSQRRDFPIQTESLVLSVAANQAAIGLQQAQRLNEQRRVASELDWRVSERTRELAETNEKLQLQVGLLQQLPVSAWTLKPDGTPDFVNRVWLEFSDQTVDFVRSHPDAWMTAVHPEDRETASRALWDGVRSGKGFAFETRSLRAKDATYRWHLQQAVALRDAEGKVLKFVGTTTDIDDQKRAEEELRTSEANLRRVIDTIPTLSWCNLPDGPNEFLSKSWHEYTGLSPEEAYGWGWSAAFHPDDLPPLMEKWQKMLVSGESDEIEARLRRHDGVYRWFLIRAQAFRDDSGRIVRWYGTSTDIEDRKRGEEALQDREQSLRLILDGIAGLVAIMSATGEVEAVNRQVLEYFGKPIEQMKGWSTNDAVHPDDLPGVMSAWRRSIEAVSPYDFDHRLRRADGVYRWFHARGLPLRDSEGHVLRWYVLLTDIDDRTRAEEELRNTQAELGMVMRAMTMGQLTASMAHEVNQPLSGIVTNAGTCLRMLDANPPNLEGARETVRRTIRDGKRASEIMTRLRTLYSKKEPALEPMDLNEATREVIALSLSELRRNRVALRQELAEDLPLVMGDRIQIQQVILNLVRNGSDAMSAVDDRPRELRIKTESDEISGVRLSVKDTGVGFDTHSEEKLFEAFYTTKTDGMGIGLSVSRSIMENHRGRLWAIRNDGPGATFVFSIPRSLSSTSPSTDGLLSV